MYQHFALSRLLLLSSILLFSVTNFTGCGLQKKLARKVGMRSNTVHIQDLGKDFAQYKNTEFDYFNPSKKVTQKTKRKAEVIKYNTFKLKSVDPVIVEANMMYAQYRFADHLATNFAEGIDVLTTKELLNLKANELNKAVKKRSEDEISQIRKVKKLYTSAKMTYHSIKDLVTRAENVKNNCIKMIDKVQKEFMKDPIKAVMVPQIISELKDSIEKLTQAIGGIPSTVGKLAKVKQLGDVGDQIDRVKDLF
jgi:hypothetical protein